jgi:hypothetical protein
MSKEFIGKAEIVKTQFGEIISISYSEEDLKLMMSKLENGHMKTKVLKSKKGNYYQEIDNWKPSNS